VTTFTVTPSLLIGDQPPTLSRAVALASLEEATEADRLARTGRTLYVV
jgi:hypothetical protein